MTGPQDTYAALHAQLAGDAQVTQQTADSWIGMYTSLNELAAALSSHQVALLSNSGWSGPAAEQFQAYMTAMTQQVKGAADSAAVISTQLQDAAGTLHSAQQAIITAEQQPAPPNETPDQRAQRLTPIAQEQVQTVSQAYGKASQTLAQAQAVAPTPTYTGGVRSPGATTQPGISGSAAAYGVDGRSPGRAGYNADSSGVTGRSPGPAGSRIANPSGQSGTGDGVDGTLVSPAGVVGYEPGQGPAGGRSPGAGRPAAGPGPGDGLPTDFWPGGSGVSGANGVAGRGPGSQNDGLGDKSGSSRAGSHSSAGGDSPAYGDGSEGIHGGVRGASTLPGRRIGDPAARPIGEVEPGIIGGEPVGGGRVVGNRGTGYGGAADGGKPGGVGEGISGGRLEASQPEGMRRVPWGRSAMAAEGETAGASAGGMPMGGAGAGAGQEKERGKRPKYLKQDPEYWQPKVEVVPPVIE